MSRERLIFAAVIVFLITAFLYLEVSRLYGRVGRLETAVVQILNARQAGPPVAVRPNPPLQKAPVEEKKTQ